MEFVVATYQGVVPRFVIAPNDQVVAEGATAEFCCAANGRDRKENQPKISWLKDGITIDVLWVKFLMRILSHYVN